MKEIKPNKSCSKCGIDFSCKGEKECWCFDYTLSEEQLNVLKENYDNCLCGKCLGELESGTKVPS